MSEWDRLFPKTSQSHPSQGQLSNPTKSTTQQSSTSRLKLKNSSQFFANFRSSRLSCSNEAAKKPIEQVCSKLSKISNSASRSTQRTYSKKTLRSLCKEFAITFCAESHRSWSLSRVKTTSFSIGKHRRYNGWLHRCSVCQTMRQYTSLTCGKSQLTNCLDVQMHGQ